MAFRKYETIYVMRPDLTDEAVKRVNERLFELIKSEDGQLLHVDNWGSRKTAYPVQKFNKGFFQQVTYVGDPGIVAKLERVMRILDEVMKFFSLKVSDEVSAEELAADTVFTTARKDEGDPKRRRDDRHRRDDRRRDDRPRRDDDRPRRDDDRPRRESRYENTYDGDES